MTDTRHAYFAARHDGAVADSAEFELLDILDEVSTRARYCLRPVDWPLAEQHLNPGRYAHLYRLAQEVGIHHERCAVQLDHALRCTCERESA